MKTLLKWFWMLSKRLYKKPSFLVILAVIPLCALALTFAAQQQSGFLKIVLAQEDPHDPLSSQVIQTLTEEHSLIQFVLADSPEAALKTVTTGSADCAWIFPEDMQGRIDRFVAKKSADAAVVRMVERERTVFSRIAQEKLSSLMYKYCTQAEYLRYARVEAEQLAHVSEEQLLETYESIALTEDLFTFENALGDTNTASSNYMTAPIRGILAVLICLCGAAAAAYYLQDQALGTFSLVKEHLRPLVAFGCMLIAIIHVAVIAFATLWLTGMLAGLGWDLLSMVLFSLCCAGFWLLMIQLFPSAKALCATVPILVLIMVAFCPVFFHLPTLDPVGQLLPPTYYIAAAYNRRYLLYMPLYTLVVLLGATGIHWLKSRLRLQRKF